MKIAEIRSMNDEELRNRAQELRQEKLNLRIQQQGARLERPSRLHEIRKIIAKIETTLSERRIKKASSENV